MGTEVRQGRIAGIVGPLALAAILALSWMLQKPPTPVPTSAPAAVFSAQRAYADLRQIGGREPTPIGSAGSDAIRDHLAAALAAAGFGVEVHNGVGSRTFRSTTVAGRVHNVVATLPGYDSTGQVLLAAHYDTTFGSPGASDDRASVAALMETARALASGEPLRNDIVMIFTDGEEAGLLGASSFVAEHTRGAKSGVVLNWEATGNAGPSVLFETSSGNAELIKEFAASAPFPIGDSAMAALYQAGMQNTDFTAFRDAGFVGLNFAFIGGVAWYHNSVDTVAQLDTAGLQHMGSNMLGLTRGLGQRDLAELRSEHDAVFFGAFGHLVTYPIWLVWPLAGLAVLIITALAVLARRRGQATTPRLLAGVAAALLSIIGAPLAAIGLWQLLIMIRPGVCDVVHGGSVPSSAVPVCAGRAYRDDLAGVVSRTPSPDRLCMPGDWGVGVAGGLGCCYCVVAAGDVVLRFARCGRSRRRRIDRTAARLATTRVECGCVDRGSNTRHRAARPGRPRTARRTRHRQRRCGGVLLRPRWAAGTSSGRTRAPNRHRGQVGEVNHAAAQLLGAGGGAGHDRHIRQHRPRG